jgi:hypothetical protein
MVDGSHDSGSWVPSSARRLAILIRVFRVIPFSIHGYRAIHSFTALAWGPNIVFRDLVACCPTPPWFPIKKGHVGLVTGLTQSRCLLQFLVACLVSVIGFQTFFWFGGAKGWMYKIWSLFILVCGYAPQYNYFWFVLSRLPISKGPLPYDCVFLVCASVYVCVCLRVRVCCMVVCVCVEPRLCECSSVGSMDNTFVYAYLGTTHEWMSLRTRCVVAMTVSWWRSVVKCRVKSFILAR